MNAKMFNSISLVEWIYDFMGNVVFILCIKIDLTRTFSRSLMIH